MPVLGGMQRNPSEVLFEKISYDFVVRMSIANIRKDDNRFAVLFDQAKQSILEMSKPRPFGEMRRGFHLADL